MTIAPTSTLFLFRNSFNHPHQQSYFQTVHSYFPLSHRTKRYFNVNNNDNHLLICFDVRGFLPVYHFKKYESSP